MPIEVRPEAAVAECRPMGHTSAGIVARAPGLRVRIDRSALQGPASLGVSRFSEAGAGPELPLPDAPVAVVELPRDADGAQIHGANRLEIAWTIAPVLILFAIAAFVFAKLPGIQDVPAATGGEENLVVEVTGTQFTWYFEYPNGVVSVDRLTAPEGRTVELKVTAPDWDVVHSWWIPALGGKIDAIPGKVNTTWFSGERVGVFPGQCAELCGIYHAKMLASVEVLPADEFDAWLAEREEQQAAGTSPLGEELWDGTCAKCHGMDGDGGYGPRIAGSELLADENAVERLLRDGRRAMPPVGRDWNDTEMDALLDYLEQNLGG